MSTELLANFQATTTLAADITDSALSLQLTSTTFFPAGPKFRLKISNEILTVTAGPDVNGICTVTRGDEGTTAVAHTAGTIVIAIITAAALRAFVNALVMNT